MKKTLMAAAISTGIIFAAQAQANDASMTLAYKSMSSDSINVGALHINYRSLGARWENFGWELGLTTPIAKDSKNGIDYGIGGLNYHLVYVKEVAPKVEVSGKLGIEYVNFSASGSGISISDTEVGLGYGVEARYAFSEKVSGVASFGGAATDPSVTSFSFGAAYKF